MKVLEAKAFLVQQTAEQAVLENVPLSDLEKRMMYFTETDECPEDPIALNEAFETEYSTEKYEAKISRLLHHAYKRVRRDDSQNSESWAHFPHSLAWIMRRLIMYSLMGLFFIGRYYWRRNRG